MNKFEKLMCAVLGAALAWYVFTEMKKPKPDPAASEAGVVAQTNAVGAASSIAVAQNLPAARPASEPSASEIVSVPSVPEKRVVLENGQLKLELSSWGAVVTKATLKEYARDCGEIGEKNPALEFDFSASPLGQLRDVPELAANAAYEVRTVESNSAVFVNAAVTRKITLGDDFKVAFEETFHKHVGETAEKPMSISLGAMRMGGSKNDLLSVDSLAKDAGKGKEGVLHHCEGDSPLKNYLVGGLTGGCGGSKSAAGLPFSSEVEVRGAQKWIAVKNRFFVTALASSSDENVGFSTRIVRDVNAANYRPQEVLARVLFASVPEMRSTVFYVGPKKQSLLWDLGMKDVMEFGMWRWICYPLVWILNFFNSWIPGYGIAIILLTIFVRVLFWPLTHKSTVGMKKMQELQPLMKELQAKFKDNPQRLQQETWALYKEKKVNPMSSCLPMLIQIPVFIALFNVLRAAVELRYSGFLWISDLSEPEALFSSWFPFGGLNILPVLMALTTGLQSAFTPSTGDKNQQRMMMIFMPIMMLFMFYSFPSALSLYWFLSNIFSIGQMWIIRRQTAAGQRGTAVVPEVIDPPVTRQMRRHQG